MPCLQTETREIMSKTIYTLSDIMDDLLREYYMVNEGDTDALRKAIQRVCEKIPAGKVNLWQKSTKYKDRAKKPYHEFDELERDLILSSPQIHKYVYRHKSPKEQEAYEEAEKQAEWENNAEQRALESGERIAELREVENGNPDPLYISDAELQSKKLMLMVEAIYSLYFEPIDEKELRNDMRLAGMWQGSDVTPDCVLARLHLQQGSKHYCRARGKKKS